MSSMLKTVQDRFKEEDQKRNQICQAEATRAQTAEVRGFAGFDRDWLCVYLGILELLFRVYACVMACLLNPFR